MGADILERLELMLHARLTDEDTIIREAAAEIVRLREKAGELAIARSNDIAEIGRLRGEVEALRQCGVKYLGWLGVKDAENGLRKDMADPEMVDRPAPAMPNGVEYDRELIAEMLDMYCAALTNGGLDGAGHYTPATIDEQAQLLRDADNHEARTVTRAADNRDAAGVEYVSICGVHQVNDPNCHNCSTKIEVTPAAVPAGEATIAPAEAKGDACPRCRGTGETCTGTIDGIPELFDCRDCLGSGMFTAPVGATIADAASDPSLTLDAARQLLRDVAHAIESGRYNTPQPADGEAVAPLGYVRRKAISAMREDDEVTGIMVHVDAPSDSVPVYLHPPAPVQAAPQEGEQDTSRWPLLDRVEFALRDAGFDYDEAFRIAHMAANPSACELGAWNDAIEAAASEAEHWQALSGSTHKCGDYIAGAIRTMKRAALQHRGDSRGGES